MNNGNEKAAMTVTSEGTQQQQPPPSNDVKLAGEESKERMYESKHHKKVVRVLTVLAYVLSVSLAAIMLSLYYVFLWDPRSSRNTTRFTAAQLPSSRPSPTRCPPDLGALPPGIVNDRGQGYYPVTTPSLSGDGDDNDLLGEDDVVEPPRALPRAPPKEAKPGAAAVPPLKQPDDTSESPPIAA